MKMKKKILVVEDNLILCDILERWLLKAGYEVMTAADEPSARGKIKKHETALVLTDVRLPEGDGISLLEWSVRQKQFIPFVVMTEYASIADAVRAVKLGAKDYLPKPVYEEQLLELLRGLLKRGNGLHGRCRVRPLYEEYDRLGYCCLLCTGWCGHASESTVILNYYRNLKCFLKDNRCVDAISFEA